MEAFRVARARYAADLSGKGASLFGGRWNSQGNAVVYAAEHRSLAVLEELVHVDAHDAPDDLVLVTLQIPDELEIVSVAPDKLPADWRQSPAPAALQELGDQWCAAKQSTVLRVPSVIVPAESCLIINPGHAEAPKIRIASREPFVFDPRLLAVKR